MNVPLMVLLTYSHKYVLHLNELFIIILTRRLNCILYKYTTKNRTEKYLSTYIIKIYTTSIPAIQRLKPHLYYVDRNEEQCILLQSSLINSWRLYKNMYICLNVTNASANAMQIRNVRIFISYHARMWVTHICRRSLYQYIFCLYNMYM